MQRSKYIALKRIKNSKVKEESTRFSLNEIIECKDTIKYYLDRNRENVEDDQVNERLLSKEEFQKSLEGDKININLNMKLNLKT